MKKIEYWYGTRNDRVYGTMYVDDNTTDVEISSKIRDELMDYVDYDFEEVENKND